MLLAALSACGGDAGGEAGGELALPEPEPPVFTTFDPAALEPGDTIGELTVESAELTRVLEDSVWVGSVVLGGDLVLHGVYQRHPDWPAVELPCVDVVQASSIARVPRFPPDAHTGPSPRTWFCFENPEVALDLLGEPEPPREIVIAIDRYRVQRELSDAFDLAQLAEVLEVGPVAAATLSRP